MSTRVLAHGALNLRNQSMMCPVVSPRPRVILLQGHIAALHRFYLVNVHFLGLFPSLIGNGFLACVIHFALEDAGIFHGSAGGKLPLLRVGDDGLLTAVGISDDQFGKQSLTVAEVIPVGGIIAEPSVPPPFVQLGGQQILPAAISLVTS